METFLKQLALELLATTTIENSTIILPNKRAKVFLLNELSQNINKPVLAPKIWSIEEFISDVSQIKIIERIDLLFEFYSHYQSITEEIKQESFENFANWAPTVLQDFNEIDRYLLDANAILNYLVDIKRIEHWKVESATTPLIEKHLAFWKSLPPLYNSLHNYLKSNKIGYQGIAYRIATENIQDYSKNLQDNSLIFAGFNALNQAEEILFQHLLENNKAKVYWDTDNYFLKDTQHDAALFARRIKSTWNFYKSNPYLWTENLFSQNKKIHIYGTAKAIGQAKIVSDIVANIPTNELQNTAVVLGDENMLLPVLSTLPNNVSALNITMGYSAKNNPVQLAVSKIFRMHVNAIKKNSSSYVFYYKDVLEVLTHPILEESCQAQKIVEIIKRNNFTYISLAKIFELQHKKSALFSLIFQNWNQPSAEVLALLKSVLMEIKKSFDFDIQEDKINNAFLYTIYTQINKIQSFYEKNTPSDAIETLHTIYTQAIEAAEVSFEGEPLNGLQIMGVLESRVLNFENVIITSVNEGKFPAGKSNNSFIPYDVKLEKGLPTYKEKDAIYAYHFYHLLQRAKNVYLIYNSETDGFDSGEKSRFISQLEFEKLPNHEIIKKDFAAEVPDELAKPKEIYKSDKVLERLYEIAANGFSPSSLTAYIRNPMQFYMQRILKISEVDDVEENIALNTLGTIIHRSLEELYKPYIGNTLTVPILETIRSKIEETVLTQFKEIYKEGEIKKGKNLLAYEVAKRNILNFVKNELADVKNGDSIEIIALEQKLSRQIHHQDLDFKVLISGNVDRIEKRNDIYRIIDYKTGKVENKNVTLSSWEKLTQDIKNEKIIQLLAYAYMFSEDKNAVVEAGIISFKNLKAGFMPVTIFKETLINTDILLCFENELVSLIRDIFCRNCFTE